MKLQRVGFAYNPTNALAMELAERAVGWCEVHGIAHWTLQAADLAEAINAATRQYAKRQETWFRHQLRGPVESFDASGAPEALANEVLARYRAAAT